MSKKLYEVDPALEDLFRHSAHYPTRPEHAEPTEYADVMRREMVIHLCRSHFGELLIVAANTGRKILPRNVYDSSSWLDHATPSCNIGGWKTRFDGGRNGLHEPSLIVALYYKGEEEDADGRTFYRVGNGTALVLTKGFKQSATYVHAPQPKSGCTLQMLHDDGLEAVHSVLYGMMHDRRVDVSRHYLDEPNECVEIEGGTVDDRTVSLLLAGVGKVMDSFGQGDLKELLK